MESPAAGWLMGRPIEEDGWGGVVGMAIGEWRPGAEPAETKTDVERGRDWKLPGRASGLCCVTPGLRDPSCPALASFGPGNQGPVIHPELPSPRSGEKPQSPWWGRV